MHKLYYTAILIIFHWVNAYDSHAQLNDQFNTAPDPNHFPELINTPISGAPVLSKPILVTGTSQYIMGEGLALAAPAFYDWDGDGLKDLLVGEFGSGTEFGKYMGSFIRVYLNVGTEAQPEFTGKFDYARPPFEYKTLAHGTPYSVDQYCCIGFTPQFIDLDHDGYLDMITGQYQGEVSWFRGSEVGFQTGIALPQEGEPRGKNWPKYQPYWLYSSASFGDFTDDGLPDLIVGGAALRLSKNVGTLSEPRFMRRELLLDINGNPLRVFEHTPNELAEIPIQPPPGGDYKLSPFVVDWDDDGVLDLLVTNSYDHKGLALVNFFRGIKIDGDYRFEEGVPLFRSKDNSKEFPGCSPYVFVTDWNDDGIKDLLIGTSVVTVDSKFNHQLSWTWGHESGLAPGKEPSTLKNFITEDRFVEYIKTQDPPSGISKDDFMTLQHKGYVYVMLGSNPEDSPDKRKKSPSKTTDPKEVVTYTIKSVPEKIQAGKPFILQVSFSVEPDWFIYAPTGLNIVQHMIEAGLELRGQLPTGISVPPNERKLKFPKPIYKNGYDVYKDTVTMTQSFTTSPSTKPGKYEIEAKITWQTTNTKTNVTLPFVSKIIRIPIQVK